LFNLICLRLAADWLKVDDFRHSVSAKYEMAALDPFLKAELRQDMSQIAKSYITIR